MWEKKPILLMLMATAAILVGTIVTMVLPFVWVNTEADRIEGVIPYTPLEQEGRDIYMREGCNNCHTQTVRPLVAEVLRYGDYSKSGEFVYDRPFLWGSKRTGSDLARLGGKYPDAWHYQHMETPRSIFPKSNMPAYGWLNNNSLKPEKVRRKMQVLGFPHSEEQIAELATKNEMDAIIAYMQKLGNDIPWRQTARTEIVGELRNPFAEVDQATLANWQPLYQSNCSACHGANMEGGIGAELVGEYYDEETLFRLIYDGIPELGMPAYANLGTERVWQLVNLIKYYQSMGN